MTYAHAEAARNLKIVVGSEKSALMAHFRAGTKSIALTLDFSLLRLNEIALRKNASLAICRDLKRKIRKIRRFGGFFILQPH